MRKLILQNGAENALEVRDSSESGAAEYPAPGTLADLLAIWATNPPREAAMLRTTCARLADYLATPVNEVTIDTVERTRKGLRRFLVERKYSKNSVRTYVNHVRLLVRYASEAGWEPGADFSEEWRRVITLASEKRCGDVAQHFAAIQKGPAAVTEEDVDLWVHQATKEGLSYHLASKRRYWFWQVLIDCGYVQTLPLCLIRKQRYGVPLQNLPPKVKMEVSTLLKWKTATTVFDRPKGAQHRQVTAAQLEKNLCQLYGYAFNVCGQAEISSLAELMRGDIVRGFIEWSMNERRTKGRTLLRGLKLIAAALRQHPNYSTLDLKWLKQVLDNIPVETKSALKMRKATKVLPFDTVQAIPAKIRAERAAVGKAGRRKLAALVRNELIMLWLTILPWRQRNLRECKIGGPTPNLFKGPLPVFSDIDVPEWAAREQATNPAAEFWQVRFAESETKTGIAVHLMLPRQLIDPLQEYLKDFRKYLVRKSDPVTLLLNEDGEPMTSNEVNYVVATMTLRHGGRRCTPHLLRDVFAFAWLKENRRDYLTLSKIFWHSSPQEVISTYGWLFNESSGVCSTETWLEERDAKRKQ
jgi:integrase